VSLHGPHILIPPDEYGEETEPLINAINEHSVAEVKTLLHLGCGLVDISENMLEIARNLNPEAVYNHGDMRTIELDGLYDAVIIPESIDYMRTENELYSALRTAQKHLKLGGYF
jgi:hypothetical protein